MQLIIGLEGLSLNQADIKRLQQPCVAGVILFKRNYESSEQLKALTASIRQLRPELFISVDHEGGRVQRFRQGFTQLPAARLLVNRFRINPSQALAIAEACGFVASIELQQHGIDFSYAPVLDIDFGLSQVIGDRSYGSLTQEVTELAGAVMRGLHKGGSIAIGKHFPGHGGVAADTHGEVAIDPRAFSYLWQADMLPFRKLIQQGLNGVMPAHVIYPAVDLHPAGFSKVWLQDILRNQLNFKGFIISDDLDMAGANAIGGIKQKLAAAAEAGCDFVLLCNDFSIMDQAVSCKDTFFKNANPALKLTAKYQQKIPAGFLDLLPASRARIAQLF